MIAGGRSRRLSFRRGAERYDAVLWYGRGGLTMEFDGRHARLQFVARGGGDVRPVPRRRAGARHLRSGPAAISI